MRTRDDRARRRDGLEGGIVLITIGIVLLLVFHGGLRFPVFRTLFYFWPVFLVGAGFSLVFRQHPVVRAVVFALELTLFVALGLYLGGGGRIPLSMAPERTLDYNEEVRIQPGEEDPLLVSYALLFAQGELGGYHPEEDGLYLVTTDDASLAVDFDAEKRKLTVADEQLHWVGPSSRRTSLMLVDTLGWHLDVECVFSSLTAELDEIDLDRLELEGVFSQMHVDLPAPESEVEVKLDSAFSSATLILPEDVAYAIEVDKGLSSVQLDGRDLSSGRYASSGFEDAQDRYLIVVDAGFGSVKIESGD